MYLDPASKKWFQATIVHLLAAKQSYLIKTSEGVEYRCTQQHLKPYKPKACHLPQDSKRTVIPIMADPNVTQKHQTNWTCKSADDFMNIQLPNGL